MTQEIYHQRREAICIRIVRHSITLNDGRYLFPKCLAADYRQLQKLDKEYEESKIQHA